MLWGGKDGKQGLVISKFFGASFTQGKKRRSRSGVVSAPDSWEIYTQCPGDGKGSLPRDQ